MSIDLRGGYANSKRRAPYETSIGYVLRETGPFAGNYLNRLNAGLGSADVSFSRLNENLWSGGIDFSYRASANLTVTGGYAYMDTDRTSSRREFQFLAPSTLPEGVSLMRPDNLLGGAVIRNFGIDLIETTEGDPAFKASLTSHAYYLKARSQFLNSLSLELGARFETARQAVAPLQVFNTPSNSGASNKIERDYWLPAATLTWEFRPRCRCAERIEDDRAPAVPRAVPAILRSGEQPPVRGNPSLQDSQAVSTWRRATNGISPATSVSRWRASTSGSTIRSSLWQFHRASDPFTSLPMRPRPISTAPRSRRRRYFPMSTGSGGFFADRRLIVAIANYTYTHSKLKVPANDSVTVNRRSHLPTLRDGLLPRRRAAHRPVGPSRQHAARSRGAGQAVAADLILSTMPASA
jgi:hypothetical protein